MLGLRTWCGVVLAVLVLGAGCAKKPAPFDPSLYDDPDPVAGTGDTYDGRSTGFGEGLPDVDANQLGRYNFRTDPALETVYFGFDSSALSSDNLATISRNAQILRNRTGMVQIAGHCDDRGTQEYNLALGERRALSVREQLIRLGIAPERILTISYGKEYPAVQGSGEAVWARNRRAEFLVSN